MILGIEIDQECHKELYKSQSHNRKYQFPKLTVNAMLLMLSVN